MAGRWLLVVVVVLALVLEHSLVLTRRSRPLRQVEEDTKEGMQ